MRVQVVGLLTAMTLVGAAFGAFVVIAGAQNADVDLRAETDLTDVPGEMMPGATPPACPTNGEVHETFATRDETLAPSLPGEPRSIPAQVADPEALIRRTEIEIGEPAPTPPVNDCQPVPNEPGNPTGEEP